MASGMGPGDAMGYTSVWTFMPLLLAAAADDVLDTAGCRAIAPLLALPVHQGRNIAV
ncbi:hypothetical protein JW933_06640 [candidate division FCPU426 bacterium]|nr:hypothetical protein [candidate division FCPU426 bacterium]